MTSASPTSATRRPRLPKEQKEDAARLYLQSAKLLSSLDTVLAHRFLELNYGNYVNGAYRQGSRWISKAHRVANLLHPACAALFCPMCKRCGGHHADSDCIGGKEHDICWRPCGSAPVREEAGGEGEDAIRSCATHGEFPWRRAMQYTTLALFTGNKCLAGETLVWTTEGYRRIDSIDGPVTVAAWDGEAWVEAYAEPHSVRQPDPLYRVRLRSGRSFATTADHRVMLADRSWRRVRDLSSADRILASDAFRPPTTAGSVQSVRVSGGRRCWKTVADSRCSCRSCRRSCDARLRPEVVGVQGAAPSPADAPRCTLRDDAWMGSESPWDDPRLARGRSRSGPVFGHPSTCHVQRLGAAPVACLRSPRDAGSPSNTEGRSQWLSPPRDEPCHPLQSIGEAGLGRTESSVSDLTASCISDSVLSVEFERTDLHYDLWVPGYENFLAEGVIQHNCGKTSLCVAEFVSWALGYRPWDDTLTAPVGSGRIWLIICQTLNMSGKSTIEPIVKRYGQDKLKPFFNSSRTLSGWEVISGPTKGDIIRLASHDQHNNSKGEVSPLAGINPAGVLWDEPTEPEIRTEVTRGLAPSMSEMNWGRELIAATLIDGAPQARAYMRNEVWDVAGNRGGAAREIFAIGGSIYDNTALTRETIRQIISKWAPWERQARISGIAGVDLGRLLPDFGIETHTWDDDLHNSLVVPGTTTPSDGPIICTVDPHLVRPWQITYIQLERFGDTLIWRVVREWPTRPFKDLKHYRYAEENFGGHFEDYARILSQIEDTIPGGAARVRFRVMDPAFGDTEAGGSGMSYKVAMEQFGYYFNTSVLRDQNIGHNELRQLIRGTWTPGKPVTATDRPFFLVAKSCQNTIWGILNYVNDAHKDPSKTRERPTETGKDQVDVLRYAVMLNPWYSEWRRGDSERHHAKNQALAQRRASTRY